jgi:hypothetical protein
VQVLTDGDVAGSGCRDGEEATPAGVAFAYVGAQDRDQVLVAAAHSAVYPVAN